MENAAIPWTGIETALTGLQSAIRTNTGILEMDSGPLIGFLLLVATFNFIPTIIAWMRRHRSTAGIAALNLLFGWTLLGWALLLIWALQSRHDEPAAETGNVLDAVFAASVNTVRHEVSVPAPDTPPALTPAPLPRQRSGGRTARQRSIIGLDVRHPVFGRGTVLEVDASHDSADVQFSMDGRKHTVTLSELDVTPTAA